MSLPGVARGAEAHDAIAVTPGMTGSRGADRAATSPSTSIPSAAADSTTTARTSRISVLNDARYLTDDDRQLLAAVTGERLDEYGNTPGPTSPFAAQLALDRRTGELAPNQPVTAVYLRNRSAEIEARNYGNRAARNPYSGEAFRRAVEFVSASGQSQADLRL